MLKIHPIRIRENHSYTLDGSTPSLPIVRRAYVAFDLATNLICNCISLVRLVCMKEKNDRRDDHSSLSSTTAVQI